MQVSSNSTTRYKPHTVHVRPRQISSNSLSNVAVNPRVKVIFNPWSGESPTNFNQSKNIIEQRKPNNERERQRSRRGAWCLICALVTCGIFLAAGIIAVLVIIIPATTTTATTITSTTTTTTSTSTSSTSTTSTSTSTTSATTTTTPSCTSPNTAGAIFSFASGSAPTTYTLYTHGFTAAGSSATLSFIMTGDSGPAFHYWLLDTVSVNDTVNNANILVNGGFSTGTLTGWTQYCATNANCGGTGTKYGQLTTSTCQTGSYCYVDKCDNYDYLIQSFTTKIGNYYIISFYLRIYANGGPHSAYVMLA
ncbi:unnamed protein product [Rotaria socialis]|uniref:Uncharacterized protein n=1 Tax=Rotaria socialis TaxID=392032 RepID=A0A821I8K9_9BILA|nr:unnamed protein product [Rotaria socialis]